MEEEDSYGDEEAPSQEEESDDDAKPIKKKSKHETVYADFDEFAHLLEDDMGDAQA